MIERNPKDRELEYPPLLSGGSTSNAQEVGMRRLGLAPLLCIVAMGASGAEAAEPLWRVVSEADAGTPAEGRVLAAGRYGVYALDRAALGGILDRAPLEFTPAAKGARTLLLLPLPDGRLSLFRIEASPIMAPELPGALSRDPHLPRPGHHRPHRHGALRPHSTRLPRVDPLRRGHRVRGSLGARGRRSLRVLLQARLQPRRRLHVPVPGR